MKAAAQGLKVHITGDSMRVGKKGEELGRAERARGGAFGRSSTSFWGTQTTAVRLHPIMYT